ncbi:hypothetical protein SMC26_18575 [Actinomadura fulvescens]|uniref:Uncharacterized protein n=1 Tax=Actinomadura fulvescens TaxID=46160 RepID=A0ABP6CW37_9ACTN
MSPAAPEPARIALLAGGVRADAQVMKRQALRLRDAAATLRGGPLAPDWLDETIKDLIDRCMTAAADLEAAADRLDDHAGALLGVGGPAE